MKYVVLTLALVFPSFMAAQSSATFVSPDSTDWVFLYYGEMDKERFTELFDSLLSIGIPDYIHGEYVEGGAEKVYVFEDIGVYYVENLYGGALLNVNRQYVRKFGMDAPEILIQDDQMRIVWVD
jgi:hypothetical protein